MTEKGYDLPKIAELPVAEDTKVESVFDTSEKRIGRVLERTPQELAQEMWDIFQDIKSSWVQFVRAHEVEEETTTTSETETSSKKTKKESISFHALFDESNPIAAQFKKSPTFKALHPKLRALYSNPTVRVVWEKGMRAHASQWEKVNGTWEEYRAVEKEQSALETRYDILQKEQFESRAKPSAARRRTLTNDIAEVELALLENRGVLEALRQKSPDLAAEILSAELEQRRRELQGHDHFMWTASRRAILEMLETRAASKETLRLVVLEGQAGTGKTSFARALARKFTGNDLVEVGVGGRTKAERALFADETLDKEHPTVYRSLLQAITGKRAPDGAVEHHGRVAFLDEFNKLDNDEAGIVATALDGMRVGEKTGYHLLGADANDRVQGGALVIAAQNPAGTRFLNRTKFTPEVQRKLDIFQLDYFPQSADNPELYEAFLVSLMDQDGRIQAKRKELAPAWVPNSIKNTAGVEIGKKDELVTNSKKGGALWRITQMLHESYENLAKRKNILTDANPDAYIQGRVLPPGDVMKWLQGYRKELNKGVSLEYYLSNKFKNWIDSSFTADHDQEDKRLYLTLAEEYGLIKKAGAEYKTLPPAKISMDILTQRDIAEMSPRVPRTMIVEETEARPPELTRAVVDWTTPDGFEHHRLEIRYKPLDTPITRRIPGSPPDAPTYVALGTINECLRVPAVVGRLYWVKS